MNSRKERPTFFDISEPDWHGQFQSPVVASLFALNTPSINSNVPSYSFMSSVNDRTINDRTINDRSNVAAANTKMRKPYFQPYLSKNLVIRGLHNKDLIQGTLRVNQRNYEESYIDNPDGDNHQDIMILGMHDRNRALHGDIVVVRLKERNQWIVRESLYEAWRDGHLNMPCDEDGQPLPIPPLKPEKSAQSNEEQLVDQALEFLPTTIQGKVDKTKLGSAVPMPKNKLYNNSTFLKLGVQSQMRRLRQDNQPPSQGGDGTPDTKSDGSSSTKTELKPEVAELLTKLCIAKSSPSASAAAADATNANRPIKANATEAGAAVNALADPSKPSRRTSHRVLADMPDEDWGIPDICLHKTAEVVFILDAKNCRTAVGQLKVMTDGNTRWALFSPNDPRVPRMAIPAAEVPNGFFERPQDYSRFLFIANLVEWQATAQFARGKLYKSLGLVGDIDAETEGILMSNDVDTREFSTLALNSLPIIEGVPWTIDEKEFKYRRDLRAETIFTIDPSTARDLDDALHIKRLTDIDGRGTPGWEVGVHIADVAYFVQPHTELDSWAANRATSVYLVHKVVPMLPRVLCEELCSLNAGVDRLTFSVIWKMDDEAKIHDEWFGRTIIHSCAKLAYDHAQEMIDKPDNQFVASDLPPICNNKEIDVIKECVLNLHKLAVVMKKKRIELGSLRLDQQKLKFVLSPDTGLPVAVGFDKRREANWLVEEFMLRANMSVAKHIYDHWPEQSLLRRHPAPKAKVLRDIDEKCEALDVHVNFDDGASIAQSLSDYLAEQSTRLLVHPALVQFVMRCMQLAVYFCSNNQQDFHHYALNVPFYTHFTSPIRRYPDVVVHRLLAASLGYSPPPEHTPMQLEQVCVKCNERKVNAKAVSDLSAEMFFGLFVQEIKRLETVGVVIGILDAAFDVLLVKYNIVRRVYTARLKLFREAQFVDGVAGVLILHWKTAKKTKETIAGDKPSVPNVIAEQTLKIFSPVRVVLTPTAEPLKFTTLIEPTPDSHPLSDADIKQLLE